MGARLCLLYLSYVHLLEGRRSFQGVFHPYRDVISCRICICNEYLSTLGVFELLDASPGSIHSTSACIMSVPQERTVDFAFLVVWDGLRGAGRKVLEQYKSAIFRYRPTSRLTRKDPSVGGDVSRRH